MQKPAIPADGILKCKQNKSKKSYPIDRKLKKEKRARRESGNTLFAPAFVFIRPAETHWPGSVISRSET
ncbi:TPA: hypothetical protein ACQQHR_004651, partial [Pseudomonas aeruginosa]